MKKRPPKKAKIRAIAQPDARSAAAFTAFQREMAAAVMRPLARNGGMRRGSRAVRLVKPNDRLTSFERLEIYNVQYWMRVLDSLREDFPGVAAVLGEEKFARLAEAYLDRHPSRSYTLRNLGDRLEGFIRRNPRWTRPHTALAADLARLEWAQVVAFDGEALPVLTPADLAATPPQRLRVRLQPYLSLLTLSYPADNFLLSLKKEGRLRGEASNALEQRRPARKARKEHPPPRAGKGLPRRPPGRLSALRQAARPRRLPRPQGAPGGQDPGPGLLQPRAGAPRGRAGPLVRHLGRARLAGAPAARPKAGYFASRKVISATLLP